MVPRPFARLPAMNDSRSRPQADPACGTCRFWRLDPDATHEAGWGQCRRMPPTLPAIQDDRLVHVGVWPHTDERDWCGEWQPPGTVADHGR
jgi:hypothetical protein